MTQPEQDSGLALVSAPDGTILRIIRDDLGLPARLPSGTTLVHLMDECSTVGALNFLRALNDRQAAFDWSLTMRIAGQPTPMHFAGTAEDGRLFIVAARTSSGLTRFSEELISINNDQANALRAALKDLSLQDRGEHLGDRRLYDDLSRVNNELANLQRAMVKTNVQLEKLNAQKNRILGMAAHDLRSPLGVILSYSEFLEAEVSELLNVEQREFLAVIKETSKFMLGMVTDILDVTAIEAGELKLDRQPTDLAHLLGRSVTLNRVLAARKDIAVELDPMPVLPVMAIDGGKIEQVLNNLLSNAAKFSHPGSRVHVRATYSGDVVTMSVEDQGQGIPPGDLAKLFKPFGTASVRSTAGEQSTGLGLAIVRNLVEGHGGRIWLESEVGKGTTFFFTLPVVVSVQPGGTQHAKEPR